MIKLNVLGHHANLLTQNNNVIFMITVTSNPTWCILEKDFWLVTCTPTYTIYYIFDYSITVIRTPTCMIYCISDYSITVICTPTTCLVTSDSGSMTTWTARTLPWTSSSPTWPVRVPSRWPRARSSSVQSAPTARCCPQTPSTWSRGRSASITLSGPIGPCLSRAWNSGRTQCFIRTTCPML